MKYIVLDTNVLHNDWNLTGTRLTLLTESAQKLNHQIFIPMVVVDELVNQYQTEIKSSVEYGISDDIIKRIILRKSQDSQERHGTNYWVAILMQACVNDSFVYNYIKSH